MEEEKEVEVGFEVILLKCKRSVNGASLFLREEEEEEEGGGGGGGGEEEGLDKYMSYLETYIYTLLLQSICIISISNFKFYYASIK